MAITSRTGRTTNPNDKNVTVVLRIGGETLYGRDTFMRDLKKVSSKQPPKK